MTSPSVLLRPTGRSPAADRTRSIALAIILTCQLMVVLDATIVNVALPDIQRALHFSTSGLSWVLNAYTLTFGGLLLLGARVGDILGRRRTFIIGIALFTGSSLLGGFALSPGWLLAARALQGVGGAIAAPQALALLTTMFDEGRERTRALGLYAAVSIGGAAVGLIAGGILTEFVSWRWVLFVNVPIGIALLLATPRFLPESERHRGRFDFAGAITSTLGMVGLVYGFVSAASDGWRSPETIGAFAVGAVLLTLFLAIESHTMEPITPLGLFRDRNRAASYVGRLLLVAGMFGMFFFLTQFMQNVLGYSPLATGLGFLPLTVALFSTSQLSARVLVERYGAKPVMVLGISLSTLGTAWLTQLTVHSSYLSILGPLVLFGAGNGLAFVPLTAASLAGVDRRHAGAASGLVNVMQQVGGSLGLAILVTVFGAASRHAAQVHTPGESPIAYQHHVLADAISTAFIGSAVFTAGTLAVIVLVLRTRRVFPPVVERPEASAELVEAD
jgi:EmrB/QacA subfamily drug resistance transporter